MTINVNGGARGNGDYSDDPSYRAGVAGNVGKVFLVSGLSFLSHTLDFVCLLNHLISTYVISYFSSLLSQLPANLEQEDSCGHPSYLDTSTPLDKDARCLSGKCRTADNKCGCTIGDHCSSSELCHSDNKCYSSGLVYEDDCSADNGDDVDARCLSNKCRSSDTLCGCTIDDHCLSSSEVCQTSTAISYCVSYL